MAQNQEQKNYLATDIWTHSILLLVTGPFYLIFWNVKINNFIKKRVAKAPDPYIVFYIFGIFFGLFFLASGIIGLIGIHVSPSLAFPLFTGTIFALMILLFISLGFYYSKLSPYLAKLTKVDLDSKNLVLLLLLIPIGQIYIQNRINQFGINEDALFKNQQEQYWNNHSLSQALEKIKTIEEEEEKVKEYINYYKYDYPTLVLKRAIVNAGVPEKRTRDYLLKYYK